MTDRDVTTHDTPGSTRSAADRAADEERGVRILPSHVMREALEAVGTSAGKSRPPKLFRPERLEHLVDVVPRVRAGEVVVLQFDCLSERDQQRALDVATGIAAALDATITQLDSTPGVYIAPQGHAEVSPPQLENCEAAPTASPPATADRIHETALCALCELRPASSRFDPPIDLVLARDGSRGWAPRVAICERCRHTVRNWRFAVGWCSECERWGRRGVESPCKRVYGA